MFGLFPPSGCYEWHSVSRGYKKLFESLFSTGITGSHSNAVFNFEEHLICSVFHSPSHADHSSIHCILANSAILCF